MNVERISPHIWSLKTWFLIPIHVWLVAGENGVTLVDAGIPFMAGGIQRFIAELGGGPLQRILLTHGHSDHTGSIGRILRNTPVPVYAHRIEIPYMQGDVRYPRRKRLEQTVPRGLVQPLTEGPDGDLELVAGLRPYLAPGHSPGHTVYYHEQDQVLLAGDLFTSKGGQLRRPMAMFTGDMAQAVESSAIVGQLRPKRLEVCHGGPVFNPADQIDSYIRTSLAGALA